MSSHTKEALKMAAIAIDGLEMIQGLTRFGGPGATAALATISNIVGTLQHGLDGKTTPDAVASELDALRAQLLNNDDAADAELREKFDKK